MVLLPAVKRKIIYDNGASIKGRGISHSRKQFEVHLHKYYAEHGNNGYILFGDFTKFYDNIIHEIAKRELLRRAPAKNVPVKFPIHVISNVNT